MSEALTLTPTSRPPFPLAPAPWQCKADTYWLLYYHTGPLPEDVYAPLEGDTPTFSSPSRAGEFKGGWAMIQIVRYQETPVGSYNELILVPGAFGVPKNEQGRDRGTKKATLRITRIYVDQKETTYNGRKNWNIPKHLARFSFERLTSPDRLKVQVFPPSSSPTIIQGEKPFFSTTIQPFTYIPPLPFSTKITPWIGLDPTITQPPLLPQGNEATELAPELRAGSEEWFQMTPLVECKKMRGCWVNYEQPGSGSAPDGDSNEVGVQNRGWFPTLHPYKVGMWLEGAKITIGLPKVL